MLKEIRRNYRRIIASVLSLTLILSNLGGNVGTVFAAEKPEELEIALFMVDGQEILSAIQNLDGQEVFDIESLELGDEKKAVRKAYEELLNPENGEVYELPVSVDDQMAPDGTGLLALYRTESREVVFLFLNQSTTALNFCVNIDGYETKLVTVNANSANADIEEKQADEKMQADDQKQETAPAGEDGTEADTDDEDAAPAGSGGSSGSAGSSGGSGGGKSSSGSESSDSGISDVTDESAKEEENAESDAAKKESAAENTDDAKADDTEESGTKTDDKTSENKESSEREDEGKAEGAGNDESSDRNKADSNASEDKESGSTENSKAENENSGKTENNSSENGKTENKESGSSKTENSDSSSSEKSESSNSEKSDSSKSENSSSEKSDSSKSENSSSEKSDSSKSENKSSEKSDSSKSENSSSEKSDSNKSENKSSEKSDSSKSENKSSEKSDSSKSENKSSEKSDSKKSDSKDSASAGSIYGAESLALSLHQVYRVALPGDGEAAEPAEETSEAEEKEEETEAEKETAAPVENAAVAEETVQETAAETEAETAEAETTAAAYEKETDAQAGEAGGNHTEENSLNTDMTGEEAESPVNAETAENTEENPSDANAAGEESLESAESSAEESGSAESGDALEGETTESGAGEAESASGEGETGAEGDEGTASIIHVGKEVLDDNWEIPGSVYEGITAFQTARLRAYCVSLDDILKIMEFNAELEEELEEESEEFHVDYTMNIEGAARITGSSVVKKGENLYFAVDPEEDYELTGVYANGIELNAADASGFPEEDSRVWMDYPYVYLAENVEEDLEIIVEVEEIEVVIPSKTYTAQTEDAVFTVDVPEGAFEEEVDLQVAKIENEQQLEELANQANEAIEEDRAIAGILAYDISFVSLESGEKIEPAESVTVSMNFKQSIVTEDNEEDVTGISIVHLPDNAEAETVTTVDNKEETGFVFNTNSFSTFVVTLLSSANVSVEGIACKTVSEAIRKAKDGDTIKLLGDIHESVIIQDKSLIFDVNGHTWTGSNNTTITLKIMTKDSSLTLKGEGLITSIDGYRVIEVDNNHKEHKGRIEAYNLDLKGNGSNIGKETKVALDPNANANRQFRLVGGIISAIDSDILMEGCNLYDGVNSGTNTDYSGGALLIAPYDSDLELNASFFDCKFYNNNALAGAAIAAEVTGKGGKIVLDIANCEFTGNVAERQGGAIFTNVKNTINNPLVTVTIENTLFDENKAEKGSGGAIYYQAKSYKDNALLINNSDFTKNYAKGSSCYGGAIYTNSSLVLNNGLMQDNTSDSFGGAICINNNFGTQFNSEITGGVFNQNKANSRGGAVCIISTAETGNVNLTKCRFEKNELVKRDSSSNSGGGAVFVEFTKDIQVNMSEVEMDNNQSAGDGGAVFVAANNVIMAGKITNNIATRRGGGIYFSSTKDNAKFILNACDIIGNKTEDTKYGNGGGAYLYSSKKNAAEFNGCTVENNTAECNGGGIYSQLNNITFINTKVKGNTANGKYGGGAYLSTYGGGGTYKVENSSFYANKAPNDSFAAKFGIKANTPSADIFIRNSSNSASSAYASGGNSPATLYGFENFNSVTEGNMTYVLARTQKNGYTFSKGISSTVSVGYYSTKNIDSGVYLDPLDSFSYTGSGTIFKTKILSEAISYAKENNYKEIYICSPVNIGKADEALLNEGIIFKRNNECNTAIFNITSDEITLRGVKIDGDNIVAKEALIVVSGGTLNIEDGTEIKNGNNTSGYGGAINVGKDAKLNLNGGIISNNTAISGGGAIKNSGEFNMSGGSIEYNVSALGGGVYSEKEFNMNGGTIIKNTTNKTYAVHLNSTGYYACGGGVIIVDGEMNMTGGVVSENIADGALSNGGGISLGYYEKKDRRKPKLIMTNGTVTKNIAGGVGGGINISNGEAVIGTEIITENNEVYITENTANALILGGGQPLYWAGGGIYVQKGAALQLYNVEVGYNNAGSKAGYYGGGVAVCPTAEVDIYRIHGGVIHDNCAVQKFDTGSSIKYDADLHISRMEGQTVSTEALKEGRVGPRVSISEYMLGGFKYNWQYNNGKDVQKSDLNQEHIRTDINFNGAASREDIEEGIKDCRVHITDNTSNMRGGGIGANGKLTFGTPGGYRVIHTYFTRYPDGTIKKDGALDPIIWNEQALGKSIPNDGADKITKFDGNYYQWEDYGFTYAEFADRDLDFSSLNGKVIITDADGTKTIYNEDLDSGNNKVYHIVVDKAGMQTIYLDYIRDFGTLSVSKTVLGDEESANEEWKFDLTLIDEEGKSLKVNTSTEDLDDTEKEMVLPYTITDKDGNGISSGKAILEEEDDSSFVLKHGQTILFENIPVGWTYQVSEEDANKNNFVTKVKGSVGSSAIIDDSDEAKVKGLSGTIKEPGAEANFVNIKSGTLEISKIVAGDNASESQEWEFTLTLLDEQEKPLTVVPGFSNDAEGDKQARGIAFELKDNGEVIDSGYKALDNGQMSITLKHGQTIILKDLPIGTKYKVIEEKANTDSYITTVKTGEIKEEGSELTHGSSGIIEKDTTAKAEFTNTNYIITVKGEKIWEDANNQDGKRPGKIIVQLLADNEKLEGEAYRKEVTAKDDWKWEFTNLPKYEKGKLINYTFWEEGLGSSGYSMAEPVQPNEMNGYSGTITNEYAPDETSCLVGKVWNDAENQDGIRPESITVRLLADGFPVREQLTLSRENQWQGGWFSLPKNNNGNKIKYTVEEVNKPDLYTNTPGQRTIDASDEEETIFFTITNTHVPEVRTLRAAKVWDDQNNVDDMRPASIEVQLMANDTPKGETVVLNEENQWECEWENLPVYQNGQKIEYTVEEVNVPSQYTVNVAYKEAAREDTGEVIGSFTVTNTHIPEVRTLRTVKVWDDQNNADNLRPASIEVQLLANDLPVREAVVLNEENQWSYEWSGLPVYEEGKAIVYSVVETVEVDGYSVMYRYNEETNTFTITNHHTPSSPETPNPPSDNPPSSNPPRNRNPRRDITTNEPEPEPPAPQETIPDEPTPLDTINEPDVPLANLPIEPTEATIIEEDVPLFGMPRTGDQRHMGLWLALFGMSGLGAAFALNGRKKSKEE